MGICKPGLFEIIPLIFFKTFTLYWNVSRVDLHCCVSFSCIAKWFSYTYAPVYSFLYSFPIQVVTEHWAEFPVLLLVIYLKYNGVASQLSGASILFPHILNPHRAPVGDGRSGWWLDGGQHLLCTGMAATFFLQSCLSFHLIPTPFRQGFLLSWRSDLSVFLETIWGTSPVTEPAEGMDLRWWLSHC